MSLDIHITVIAALLLLPSLTLATTVHRCEDETGHLTFTTLGCPPGHDLKLQDTHNTPPGTLPTFHYPPEPTSREPTHELVIVGQRDDGCGNILSPEQRRKAIIHQQTPAGMSRRDVESLLGKPDKVVGRNAEQRYVYGEKKGRSHQVTFDEHGCVKGKHEKRRP